MLDVLLEHCLERGLAVRYVAFNGVLVFCDLVEVLVVGLACFV